ncbi:MAG: mechanosensitive ion channel family protein [Thermoplasmata archaeon]|nr:mechanosensitive ion channel family protein [Candidatus Sysuiplasma acidicola]MBX8645652.1 mechanosensitive ion channel family protein [Candidatus Sysuiplasma acidicola]
MADTEAVPNGGKFRILESTVILLFLIGGIVYGVNYVLGRYFKSITAGWMPVITSILILAAGYAFITILGRMMIRFLTGRIGKARAVSIHYVFILVAYILLLFIVFHAVGLSLTGLLVGGAFAGLILGQAASIVLSNFFGGLVLVLSKPIKAGDRITMATWQFGLFAPAYPPKFYSNDLLVSGYTCTVDSIGFIYVRMTTDDGRPLVVPAGIVVQALMIKNSDISTLRVRSKFEVEKALEPEIVIPRIIKEVKKITYVADGTEPVVMINETTFQSYVIAVDVVSNMQFEEPVRSEVLRVIMKTVGEIRKERLPT